MSRTGFVCLLSVTAGVCIKMSKNQTASKAGPNGPGFICIEGIDGSGKTTTARLLAQALRGTYYKTPPEPFAGIRSIIDRRATPCARFHFYLASVVFASVEIERLRAIGPVVCDRYLYSTIAYHIAMDEGLRPPAELPGVAKPDLSVLLVAEEGVRLRRLRARHTHQDNCDRRFEGNTAFMSQVLREFRKMGLIEIDTTHLAPTEVVESILGLIPQSTREAQQPALLS